MLKFKSYQGDIMKGYKIQEDRQAYLFKKSKEKWKAKALSRQEKIKTMEITIRDLRISRDKWKEKAVNSSQKIAEEKAILKEKEVEIASLKKTLNLKEKSSL